MTANEALFSFLGTLDHQTRIIVTRDIKTVCYLNRAQWWRWKSGRSKIRPIYFDKINMVVGRDLFKNITI